MADDDTADDDKQKDQSSDAAKGGEKDDDQNQPDTVSSEDHAKLRSKKNKQIADLEAELAELKSKTKEPEPKGTKDKDNDVSDLRKDFEDFKTRDRNRALAAELEVSEDQAEEVRKFIDKNPGLEADEALVLLKKRDPKKFKSEEPPAHTHGQLRPKAGSRPDADEGPSWQDRLDYGQELMKTDKRKGKQYANNLAGSFLAKAMGWDHNSIPIPKK